MEPHFQEVQAHYDLSDDFFGVFQDPTRKYSCAFFTGPNVTLSEAQIATVMLAARYTTDNLVIDYKFDFTSQYVEAEPQHVVGIDAGAAGDFTKYIYSQQPQLGGTNFVGTAYREAIPAWTSGTR